MTRPRCKCCDDAEIRSLATAFTDAANRRDSVAAAHLFAGDGVWSLPGLDDVEGQDRIAETMAQVLGRFDFLVQLLHQGTIEIDGERARARWYLSELARDRDGRCLATTAVYDDVLSWTRRCSRAGSETGRWSFAARRLSFLTYGPITEDIRHYPFPVQPATD
jgi:ketosteroid isomerase-like protein